ncbi:MAG: hypothetical protein QM278_04985 [Pseudomonadota bacterium]|nr:hypothetical protein [Pseudomonadota bacterium]
MIDLSIIVDGARRIWDMIPQYLRDWSKSEVLKFIRENIPDFFNFCKGKISSLWARITNKKAKEAVDTATSNFLSLNDQIPLDVKKDLFEQITGSQYNPNANITTQGLTEIIRTDEEKKAAAMQMAYLVAVLGQINQKQEAMVKEYVSALKITEELRREIKNELFEAEKEFVRFAEELRRLDEEFKSTSFETAMAKKAADDIIDLI